MAVDSTKDIIEAFDFNQIHKIFLDNHYYQILFPFLLIFALLSTVLPLISIFRYKESNKPITPIIFIISTIIGLFAVTYDLPSGYSIGDFMMMLFPNISAITMGILCLYIVGSMLGHDFFSGLFRKDFSAYAFFAVGAVGLGATVYYLGIVLDFWNFDPFDQSAYWSVTLAIAAVIIGITFIYIEKYALGILFLSIFGAYIWGGGDTNMTDLLIDPVIFILFIITLLVSWMGTPEEKTKEIERDLKRQKISLDEYNKEGKKSRVRDVIDVSFENNKKEYKKLTGKDWQP